MSLLSTYSLPCCSMSRVFLPSSSSMSSSSRGRRYQPLPGLPSSLIKSRPTTLSSIPPTSAVQHRLSMHVVFSTGGSRPQYVSAAISAFDDPRLQPRRSGPARCVDYAWARETRLHSKIEKRILAGGVVWSVDITAILGRDRDRDRDRPASRRLESGLS